MQAYLNDPTLKAQMLDQIRQHEQADQITKGTYGEMNGQWHGCAIGCTLHSLNVITKQAKPFESTGAHERFPGELGIPVDLAYLVDHLFENLPAGQYETWPRRVLEAIAVGADLAEGLPQILQWSILDPTYGWIAYAHGTEQTATVQRFAALVAQDWQDANAVTRAQWAALDEELEKIEAWARARAWARAGACAWARAGACAWARAGAGAWARAGAEYYQALAAETLRVLGTVQPPAGTVRPSPRSHTKPVRPKRTKGTGAR